MPVGTVVAVGTVLINNMPAAKLGDQVMGVDVHIILVPTPGGPVPTPLPHPYAGKITGGCSSSVLIEGKPAATVSSTANAVPPHLPSSPASFQAPPTNQATIIMGSPTVLIGNGGGGGGGGAGSGSGVQAEAPDLSKKEASAATATGEKTGPEEAKEEKSFIEFTFIDDNGDVVADQAYSIILPDGTVEPGTLGSDGKITKDDIPMGVYYVKFKGLQAARWGNAVGSSVDPNDIKTDAPHLEGESVTVAIYREHKELPSEEVESIDAKVSQDKVKADWTYKYDEKDKGTLPRFVFKATSGTLHAVSDVMEIGDEIEIELLKNTENAETGYVINKKGKKVKIVDVKNDKGEAVLPFTKVVIVGSDGVERKFASDEKGKIKVRGLPLGDKYKFRTAYGGKAEIV
jgi:uncharacterized Zn-binding protein involved in type VI secretion